MRDYSTEVMEHMVETLGLLFKPFVWMYMLILVFPTWLLFNVNNGVLFCIFFIIVTLWARSAKLGGILGWFIVALTVFIFQFQPESGHYIENLLRAKTRVSASVPSSQRVIASIPQSLHLKVFTALAFGLYGGFMTGIGGGVIGRRIWKMHPKLDS